MPNLVGVYILQTPVNLTVHNVTGGHLPAPAGI